MTVLKKQIEDRLKGKTAWITGGKRIGQVVARALAEQGTNIITSYRKSEKESSEIVNAAKNLGVKSLAVLVDTSGRDHVKYAVDQISKEFPRIDILVNMASVFKSIPVEAVTQADWDSNVAAHILGTFWPSQVIVPLMPSGSHIINVTDRTATGKIYKSYVPYVVTKAAVAALTKAMAVEYGEKGIFVNAIAPGPILRPPDVSETEWKKIREATVLKFTVDDTEAVEQFSLLVLYLSVITMASGYVYPLDLGKNL